MTSLLPAPKPLDTTTDLWVAWKLWASEYRLYATATGLAGKPKDVQAATFLVVIGEEGRRIYSTFNFDTEEDRKEVDKLFEKFEEHCKPVINLAYHDFVFGTRDQKTGERFDEWLTELRTLIRNCEYGELEERMLKSRIILGIKDKRLQSHLINENPEFRKLVDICRTREKSKEQVEEIQKTTHGGRGNEDKRQDSSEEVNLVQKDKGCSKCGYKFHKSQVCPAEGKKCKQCGKLNHFATVCRSKKQSKKSPVQMKPRKVDSIECGEDYFLHTVSSGHTQRGGVWKAEIEIEGKPVVCNLDTGANCSVISLRQLKTITSKQPEKSDVLLNTFFGQRKKAAGKVTLQVSCRHGTTQAQFFVVKEPVQATLSGELSQTLGLIKLVGAVTESQLYEAARPFEDTFKGLGELRGVVYHMRVHQGSQGIVKPARSIALALRDKVKTELDRMEANGVITPVTEPTEWASQMVVVVKKEKIRICLDPVDLNKALKREHYHMPTLEDIVTNIENAKYFSTLDAATGFWQIRLDKPSSYLCTMSTPYGRYRFLRMPFGIATAPEVFQRAMHQVFQGLAGVEVVMDDILVWGSTKEEHDARLRSVLQRCEEVNLKLNLAKCQFCKTEVRYLGFVLTNNGLTIDPKRAEDILAVQVPENAKELKTFLGMVNYVARFIPNMSEISSPLRDLLKKDNAWIWTPKQQESFEHLRKALTEAPVLAYYDKRQPLVLQVDASQHGVGAVVLQSGQPLAYSSRSLTEVQERYAQIEKEMLAIVHGCTRFHDYVFAQPCILVESDHRPLEAIFKKPLHQCPLRLQRMRLTLQKYSLKIQYKPGKEMFIADALSRFPSKEKMPEEEHFQVNIVQELAVSTERLQQIQQETSQDEDLRTLREYASTSWPEDKSAVPENIRAYWPYRDEIHTGDDILFRSNRLIIPSSMRNQVLDLLHAAHGGTEKMKQRARDVMYWPGMSTDIEETAERCVLCRKHKPRNQRLPMMSHDVPELPWQAVGMDLFHQAGEVFVIMVDFYSFYFELRRLKQTTAEAVIKFCQEVFATHGLPNKLVSDNGPPFNSHKFAEFMKQCRVTHITSSPHYPRSNGMAERAVQEAKKLLSKTPYDTKEFFSALLEWRNMPRDKLLQSPVQRLMGRRTRTQLPTHRKLLEPETLPPQQVAARLRDIRQRQQKYYNCGTRSLDQLHPGSTVSVFDSRTSQWSPAIVVTHDPAPRSYIVATEDGNQLRRTREHLRAHSSTTEETMPQPTGPQPLAPRRSTRQRRKPRRYLE